MTHTETVRLLLDATKKSGLLFHTLTASQRARVETLGRAYMTAHATLSGTGRSYALRAAQSEIVAFLREA